MDTVKPMDDQQLIALLRGGDLTALDTLFARHSRGIYGFFYRTTGSPTTGEDLTQDVFLRVLRYHASFRPGRPFRVWLYGIARNVLSDHRARRPAETALEDLDSEPVSQDPPPAARLERHENRTLLLAALDRLGESDRELLTLSRFHEMSHGELAELFDCTPGTIRVRVHRALQRLSGWIETPDKERKQ